MLASHPRTNWKTLLKATAITLAFIGAGLAHLRCEHTLFAQEAERFENGYVAWKKITGASGYRVQIRPVKDPERIVRDEKVKATYMKVDLPVGRYEIRTTPLNDFGRETVWSEWQTLRVVISRPPELDAESDRVLAVNNRKRDSFRFSLNGKHFFPQVTRVQVRNPKTRAQIPVRQLDIDEEGERLTVELAVTDASEGSYDLLLINPFDKVLVREGFLDLSSRRELSTLGLAEYNEYVERLSRTCASATRLPDLLIKRCEEYFVVLNLTDRDRTNLYYYLRLTGDNYYDRLSAYEYYASVCPPVFEPGREFMRNRLADQSRESSLDSIERTRIERALKAIDSCR